MTTALMLLLLGQYVVLAIAAIVEKRWWLMCYWLGASLLQLGVMRGMK